MTDTRIARPDGSTRQPMSQKFVCATCLISGSAAPTSRTNGAPAYARSKTSPSASSVVPGAHADVDRREDAAVERHADAA